MSSVLYVSCSYYANTITNACQACNWAVPGCAYPAVTGHVPPYYSQSCYPVPTLGCQTLITVTNRCTNQSLSIPVTDHGPGAACANDKSGCYSLPNYWRVIDLDTQAYLDIGGHISSGHIPCEVEVP